MDSLYDLVIVNDRKRIGVTNCLTLTVAQTTAAWRAGQYGYQHFTLLPVRPGLDQLILWGRGGQVPEMRWGRPVTVEPVWLSWIVGYLPDDYTRAAIDPGWLTPLGFAADHPGSIPNLDSIELDNWFGHPTDVDLSDAQLAAALDLWSEQS